MNYYLIEKRNVSEGGPIRLHIGKSSAGWVFALHVYPDVGLRNWDDWLALIHSGGQVEIEDENGEYMGKPDFVRTVAQRAWNGAPPTWQVLRENHAELGPNNLLRWRVDGERVIGHGEGTYDYHVGEFS